MKKIEIDEETLRGLYLILCEVPCDHKSAKVYGNAIPIMNDAHQVILRLGKQKGFDDRGKDIGII